MITIGKSGSVSPTQKAIKVLKADGWLVAVTERWNPFAKIRQDLYGFVDVLAVKGTETLAIQCTSDHNVTGRVAKIKDHENYPLIAASSWRLEVWGFTKGTTQPTRVEVM